LELLTRRDGTALEGFRHGLDMIQRDRRLFKNFLEPDQHLFAAKFADLLDRVFQNFVDKLGNFYDERKSIRRAQRSLEHSQTQAIEKAMIGYEVSAIPRLFLPSSLCSEPKGGTEGKERSSRKSKAAPANRNEPPVGKSTNPNIVQAWTLPEGKDYRDYFDSRNPEGKENAAGWPKFAHQKNPERMKGLCLKCQTNGKCVANCCMAHVDLETMDSTKRKTMDDRFKALFA
jgi:hypothetical protein